MRTFRALQGFPHRVFISSNQKICGQGLKLCTLKMLKQPIMIPKAINRHAIRYGKRFDNILISTS
jgi:hypothetical protein